MLCHVLVHMSCFDHMSCLGHMSCFDHVSFLVHTCMSCFHFQAATHVVMACTFALFGRSFNTSQSEVNIDNTPVAMETEKC